MISIFHTETLTGIGEFTGGEFVKVRAYHHPLPPGEGPAAIQAYLTSSEWQPERSAAWVTPLVGVLPLGEIRQFGDGAWGVEMDGHVPIELSWWLGVGVNAEAIPLDREITQSEMAIEFGVCQGTIVNWRRLPGFPEPLPWTRGVRRWSFAKVVEWKAMHRP